MKGGKSVMAQIPLTRWVEQLDAAGLLYRHPSEARVDELPQLLEDHPDQAVFVERVRDCDFPFLANAYASADMCALALDCDPKKVGVEVGERSARHQRAQLGADLQGPLNGGRRCRVRRSFSALGGGSPSTCHSSSTKENRP
jgi:hypothetical protein